LGTLTAVTDAEGFTCHMFTIRLETTLMCVGRTVGIAPPLPLDMPPTAAGVTHNKCSASTKAQNAVRKGSALL
jgi:hypothetical protein